MTRLALGLIGLLSPAFAVLVLAGGIDVEGLDASALHVVHAALGADPQAPVGPDLYWGRNIV